MSIFGIFYVQLKATNKEILDDQVRVVLRRSSLEYYQSLPLPILLVVYSGQTEEFWGVWINQFLKTKEIPQTQKSVQITLRASDVIDESFVEHLANHFSLGVHKRVAVNCISDHDLCERYHSILKPWLREFYKNLLVFEDGHLPVYICYVYDYKDGHLHIQVEHSISGKYDVEKVPIDEDSDLLIYPINDFSQVPRELREILFLTASLLAKEDVLASLRLYNLLLSDYSGKYKNFGTLFDIGALAFENNRIAEFQELVKKAIDSGNYDDFQTLNMVNFRYQEESTNVAKEHYMNNLLYAISSVKDDRLKGTLSYNLANYYRGNKEPRKALRYYMQARNLETDYLSREYWWYEVAGVFFVTRHYRWAEAFYLRAFSLSSRPKPLIFALIADCLFFQGKFAEASKWFHRYLTNNAKPESEWYLKHWAAEHFVSSGLHSTIRRPRLAIGIAQRALRIKELDESCNTLIEGTKLDPLCGLAWFHLGLGMLRQNKKKDALHAFLISSLAEDRNTAPWLNSLFSAMNLREDVLVYQLLDTMKHKSGDGIYKDIIAFLKEQGDLTSESKAKLFAAFKSLFQSLDMKE